MDGWQLPLAPEQAFSLALAQERVGVMQFSTPSESLMMNFAPVVIGAKGDKGDPGEGLDAGALHATQRLAEFSTPTAKSEARSNLELEDIDCGTFN